MGLELPNIGETADPSVPVELPTPDRPPAEFPDLAAVPESFVAVGGGFFVAELGAHVVAMGGFKPLAATPAGTAEVLRVRVHPATRRRRVGSTLMAVLEGAAHARGVARLVLDTADNQPEAIAFSTAIGYVEAHRETQPGWSWTLVYFSKYLDSGGCNGRA